MVLAHLGQLPFLLTYPREGSTWNSDVRNKVGYLSGGGQTGVGKEFVF